MEKQEIIRRLFGLCPTMELDGDKIYLDRDHLLVYLEPSDGKIMMSSEIHRAKVTYLIGEDNFEMWDKLMAIWAEFIELNLDMV